MPYNKITLIIPTLNADKYICRCLDCLVKQTFVNFLIIIIDDNSSDSTIKLAQPYQKKLQLVIIKKPSSVAKGAAASINYATKLIKTPLFAILDADSYLANNWVKTMTLALEKDIIAGAPILAYRGESFLSYLIGLEIESRYKTIKSSHLLHLSNCNLAGRSEILKRFKYDQNLFYAYDHKFSFELNNHGIYYKLVKNTHCYHHNRSTFWSYFQQQFYIAKNHTQLFFLMPINVIRADQISSKSFIIQPLFVIIIIIFLFFKPLLSLFILLMILLLNIYYYRYLVAKKQYAGIIVATLLIIIKNIAWVFGLFIGISKFIFSQK